jgi:hypothetical protein
MLVSPPPTSNPSSRLTPSLRLAATGCSPRPPAAPAPTAPPSSRSWTSCGPATAWPSGSSTASADHCGTWSTPSPGWLSAGSGSAASRRRSTPPGGKLVFHVFAALAEFERDLTGSGPLPGWLLLGPAAATAADHRCSPGTSSRWPRRCTALGSTPWRRSPRPWGSAAPRSAGTSLTPTALGSGMIRSSMRGPVRWLSPGW